MKTVLIYVNPDKQVGDPEHLKVFATADASAMWFQENNPEGIAFEYPVIGASSEAAGQPDDQFFEAPGG
jgi:hypothetical protein